MAYERNNLFGGNWKFEPNIKIEEEIKVILFGDNVLNACRKRESKIMEFIENVNFAEGEGV